MSVSLNKFTDLLVSGKGEFNADGYTFQPQVMHATIEVIIEIIRRYFAFAPNLWRFLTSQPEHSQFHPLNIIGIRRLRDVWPDAAAGEVRACKLCPQLQLEAIPERQWGHGNFAAVDAYHFWNETSGRRLVVKVEHYCRDIGSHTVGSFIQTGCIM